jgi:hypothetical protein
MVLITMPALKIKTRMFKVLDLYTHVGPMGMLKGTILGGGGQ